MDFSTWIRLIALTVQLNSAFGYVAKATVEALSIVPLGSNKTNLNAQSGKVEKLLHVRKPNVSKNLISISQSLTDLPRNDRHTDTDGSENSSKTQQLSSRFLQKRHGDFIYNRTNNPLISSESWNDLNTLLPEKEMKEFLSSLPLHMLRNLTSMTRKNPELGQQQLVRLILDRSERFKYTIPGVTEINKLPERKVNKGKISGHKSNKLADDNALGNEKPTHKPLDTDESHEPLDFDSLHTSNPTTTTPLPVLEPPNKAQHSTIAPSTETYENNRVLESEIPSSLDPVSESPSTEDNSMAEPSNKNAVHSPRQISSFNSGYFIPLLTPDTSSKNEPPVDVTRPNQLSWQFQPQDPENTFQPNTDNFLQPPSQFDENDPDGVQRGSTPPVLSSHPPSSSVWVPEASLVKDQNEHRNHHPNHPFSGFNSIPDLRLQASASRDHINTNSLYDNQDQGHGYQDLDDQPPESPLEIGGEPQEQPHTDYHYTHSTIKQGPSNSNLYTQAMYHQKHQESNNNHNYKGNSNTNGQSSHSDNDNNKSQNGNNNPHHQQINSPQFPPHLENNPSQGGGHGWGGGDGDDGFWNSAKAYFNKGEKSTAEKVFEISLAILSFLAFGGYLIMLIYQVFAASSVVPLFPFFSNAIPANPTITGVLLGRSLMNQNPITLGRGLSETYINELENIVKGAMDRVKSTLESKGGSSVKVKGDLGKTR